MEITTGQSCGKAHSSEQTDRSTCGAMGRRSEPIAKECWVGWLCSLWKGWDRERQGSRLLLQPAWAAAGVARLGQWLPSRRLGPAARPGDHAAAAVQRRDLDDPPSWLSSAERGAPSAIDPTSAAMDE